MRSNGLLSIRLWTGKRERKRTIYLHSVSPLQVKQETWQSVVSVDLYKDILTARHHRLTDDGH